MNVMEPQDDISLNINDYMTIDEFAETYPFIGLQALRLAVKNGALRAYQPRRKLILIRKDDFKAWFASTVKQPEVRGVPAPKRAGQKRGRPQNRE